MSTASFSQTGNTADSTVPPLVGRTRRRAALRLGWYLHALIFVLVNLGLAANAWLGGGHAAALPPFGWSLGLTIHGLAVLLVHLRLGLLERVVEQERALRNMG